MEESLELNFVFYKIGKHGSTLTIHELIWAWSSWGNFSLSESFQLHYQCVQNLSNLNLLESLYGTFSDNSRSAELHLNLY